MQYVRQEKAIASADSGGIRQRWMWGLRLLRDPEAMSSEKSLRHGVTEQLIAAAKAVFPLDQFEPTEATLKELLDYTEQGEELTARFAAHDQKRRAYVDSLVRAAEGDLSMTWQDAQMRLGPDGDA